MVQKARKMAQSVRPNSERLKDRKSTPQAMTMSTNEKRRKSDKREYESPPPIPCTPKELNVLLDKWIVDGVFKPNLVSREPIKDEQRDLHFCRLHNYVQHATVECWALYRLIHRRIKEGTLELTQPKVQRNPLLNHKGKGVVAVVICVDLGKEEDERPSLPIGAIMTL